MQNFKKINSSRFFLQNLSKKVNLKQLLSERVNSAKPILVLVSVYFDTTNIFKNILLANFFQSSRVLSGISISNRVYQK